MSILTYQQLTQTDTYDEIRHRYHSEIDRLERLGFEELCFYREVLFPLSAILFFPLALLMLFKREIVKLAWFPFQTRDSLSSFGLQEVQLCFQARD